MFTTSDAPELRRKGGPSPGSGNARSCRQWGAGVLVASGRTVWAPLFHNVLLCGDGTRFSHVLPGFLG